MERAFVNSTDKTFNNLIGKKLKILKKFDFGKLWPYIHTSITLEDKIKKGLAYAKPFPKYDF